jgi:hypothetical protein
MPISEIVTLALVGAVLGAALGALGGGGGIIAIPLLIHVAGQPVDQATTTSLVVVALGAAAGLVPHALAGRVDWRGGLTFAALGVAGAFVGGTLALLMDDRLQVVGIFALMLLAAQALLRNADDSSATTMRHRVAPQPGMRVDTGIIIGADADAVDTVDPVAAAEESRARAAGGGIVTVPAARARPAIEPQPYSWWRLVGAATVTGLITGIFGVGGGFVAVPALVFGLRLPIKIATATGLLVIVVNSLVALLARGPGLLDPGPTLVVGGASVAAAIVAALLSRHISPTATRRTFGLLLIGLAFWELAALATLS